MSNPVEEVQIQPENPKHGYLADEYRGKLNSYLEFDRGTVVATIIALIIFVTPFFIINHYFDLRRDIYHGGQIFSNGIVFSAATAVFSRVMLRVVFVSGFFRVVFRSAFQSVFRMMSRVSLRLMGGKQGKVLTSTLSKNLSQVQKQEGQPTSHDLRAIFFSWLVMSASFVVVYWAVWDVVNFRGITGIGICLLVLYVAESLYCRMTETEYDFIITKEGILIQTLFSFSLSFLPLVYDTNNYDGSVEQKGKMSLIGISSLVLLGILSGYLSRYVLQEDLYTLSQIAFLFVMMLSFPIKPLEGGDIIAWKRWFGILVFLTALIGSSLLLEEKFINII